MNIVFFASQDHLWSNYSFLDIERTRSDHEHVLLRSETTRPLLPERLRQTRSIPPDLFPLARKQED